jgi:hypothetical protein
MKKGLKPSVTRKGSRVTDSIEDGLAELPILSSLIKRNGMS